MSGCCTHCCQQLYHHPPVFLVPPLLLLLILQQAMVVTSLTIVLSHPAVSPDGGGVGDEAGNRSISSMSKNNTLHHHHHRQTNPQGSNDGNNASNNHGRGAASAGSGAVNDVRPWLAEKFPDQSSSKGHGHSISNVLETLEKTVHHRYSNNNIVVEAGKDEVEAALGDAILYRVRKVPVVHGPFQFGLLVVIMIVSILANGFIIVNVTRDSLKLKMIHFLLIRHVCITDFLGTIFILPLPMVAIIRGEWTESKNANIVCSIISTTTALFWTMHLIAVALYRTDRVLAVWLPSGRYPICSRRVVNICLVSIWITAIIGSSLATFTFGYTFQPALALCIPDVPIIFFIVVFSGYLIALISLSTGYLLAFARKRKRRRKGKESSHYLNNNNTIPINDSNSNRFVTTSSSHSHCLAIASSPIIQRATVEGQSGGGVPINGNNNDINNGLNLELNSSSGLLSQHNIPHHEELRNGEFIIMPLHTTTVLSSSPDGDTEHFQNSASRSNSNNNFNTFPPSALTRRVRTSSANNEPPSTSNCNMFSTKSARVSAILMAVEAADDDDEEDDEDEAALFPEDGPSAAPKIVEPVVKCPHHILEQGYQVLLSSSSSSSGSDDSCSESGSLASSKSNSCMLRHCDGVVGAGTGSADRRRRIVHHSLSLSFRRRNGSGKVVKIPTHSKSYDCCYDLAAQQRSGSTLKLGSAEIPIQRSSIPEFLILENGSSTVHSPTTTRPESDEAVKPSNTLTPEEEFEVVVGGGDKSTPTSTNCSSEMSSQCLDGDGGSGTNSNNTHENDIEPSCIEMNNDQIDHFRPRHSTCSSHHRQSSSATSGGRHRSSSSANALADCVKSAGSSRRKHRRHTHRHHIHQHHAKKSSSAKKRAYLSYALSIGHLLLYLPAMFVIGLAGSTLPPGVAFICSVVVYCEFLIQPSALMILSHRLRTEITRMITRRHYF